MRNIPEINVVLSERFTVHVTDADGVKIVLNRPEYLDRLYTKQSLPLEQAYQKNPWLREIIKRSSGEVNIKLSGLRGEVVEIYSYHPTLSTDIIIIQAVDDLINRAKLLMNEHFNKYPTDKPYAVEEFTAEMISALNELIEVRL